MISTAKVIKILNDDIAVVEVSRQTACASDCHSDCASYHACSKTSKTVVSYAKNTIDAKIGDIVKVSSKTSTIILNAIIVYVLPIILFFCGYFATSTLYQIENLRVLGGFISFTISIVFAIIYNRKISNKITIEII